MLLNTANDSVNMRELDRFPGFSTICLSELSLAADFLLPMIEIKRGTNMLEKICAVQDDLAD